MSSSISQRQFHIRAGQRTLLINRATLAHALVLAARAAWLVEFAHRGQAAAKGAGAGICRVIFRSLLHDPLQLSEHFLAAGFRFDVAGDDVVGDAPKAARRHACLSAQRTIQRLCRARTA